MPTQARAPVARKNTENTTAYGAGAKPDARAVIGRWAGLESDEPLRTASYVPSQYRKRKTGLSARCRMLQTMLHGGRGGNRTPDTGLFNPLLYQLSYPAGTLRRWAVRGRTDTGRGGGRPANPHRRCKAAAGLHRPGGGGDEE